MQTVALRRRYGHAALKYPMRELSGATTEDTFRAASASIGSTDPPLEPLHLRDLISREDVERAIAGWEEIIAGQVGRKLRFTRWREFSPLGHWRYVSVNRSVGGVAVVEEQTYGVVILTNRTRFGFRAGGQL